MNISMCLSAFHNLLFLELDATAWIIPKKSPNNQNPSSPTPKKLQQQKYPAELPAISAMETLYIKLKCLIFFMLN